MSKPGQSTANYLKIFEYRSMDENKIASLDEEQASSLPYFDNIMNPTNQVTCDRCRKDITFFTHLLCEGGDFCVPCFANLNPFPESYHVIGNLNYSLFHPRWSAHEELLFFSALEKFGYANWNEIMIELGTTKSVQEIEQHYEKMFNTEDQSYPIVINQKGELSFKKAAPSSREEKTTIKKNNELRMLKEQMDKRQVKIENQYKMISYLPKRGDFQIEYDNELELIISEMQFLDSDTPEAVQLKNKILSIYCERLNKRNLIKDFVIERKLLDLNELNKRDRQKSKQEKEVAALLRPFARFSTSLDHERLIAGIIKERILKDQITSSRKAKKDHQSSNSKRRSVEIKKKIKSKPGTVRLPFLTEKQFQLCQNLQINQIAFVLIKQTIKSEISRRGKLPVDYFYTIFKLNPTIVNYIFDFTCQNELRK